MSQLYPLKFKPLFIERLWGGTRLKSVLHKSACNIKHCAESWELSAVDQHVSVALNGFLKGNNLSEIVEIYMGDLMGDKIYEKYGIEFPLLIKFIDAEEDLSVQVHPGDELAKIRHNAYGKTEMWYVVDAYPGSRLNLGFNQPVDRGKYLRYLRDGRITELLHFEDVKSGDVFFIPAGRIHTLGKGILVAEIQQTSDITYRIYDFDRKDNHGKIRKLHNDLAIDAIDFSIPVDIKTRYTAVMNKSSRIMSCPYFTTNVLDLDQPVAKDYSMLDSFIIYMGIHGDVALSWQGGEEMIHHGETVLVPAILEEFTLIPGKGVSRLLEIYIE